MRIVIAPDKFKECLDAQRVAEAIAEGVRDVLPQAAVDLCPLSDGGEGLVQTMLAARGGKLVKRIVTGPLVSRKVEAAFALLDDGRTAVIEMASASGLALLARNHRNPLRTTTYGTGELLCHAVALGAKHIILGIGGSATTDGGIGCAQACGARFTFENGSVYSAGDRRLCGADVMNILRARPVRADDADGIKSSHASGSALAVRGGSGDDVSSLHRGRNARRAHEPQLPDFADVQITVACDVGNPLYGEHGAARVFGPQKGATEQQVTILDEGLKTLAERLGKKDLAGSAGAGAAGGLGFGMMAFFGAEIRSGIELVLETLDLRQRLTGSALCITAEGNLDAQSLTGKAPMGVARLCQALGVPCIVLAGGLGTGAEQVYSAGVGAAVCIVDKPMSLQDAIANGARLLRQSAATTLRIWGLGRASRR